MQVKIRIIVAHKAHTAYYLSKRPPELTHDLDRAITFVDMAEASEWMLNSQYAPIDHESYEYKRMEVTKRVLGDESDEREHEALRES